MNNKKSLMFSIIAILVMGLIVSGGTFAYLQWSTGYSAGTSVNVTIEMGGITMHIESDAKEFVGLYPTKIDDASDCDRARFGDALVTIVNSTGTMAVPSFKLKVKVTKGGSDALTKDALSHIRYSVVPVTTTIDGSGNPVKGNEVSSCYTGVTGGTATGDKYDVETSWTTAGFKFESVSTAGAWSHIPTANDYVNGGDNKINTGYLPRQYNTTTESVSGITFKAPQYSTTYQYYRVYVWLDEGYTTTIIGDTITDPLQNAKIEVMWSEESMVEQVTGSGTATEYPNAVPNGSETVLEPGLYQDTGTFTSWEDLIDNGDITLDENRTIITESNTELTGELIIPEGITEIGLLAFANTSIETVTFPVSLLTIVDNAFLESSLKEITFPSDSLLTTIGDSAFAFTLLEEVKIPKNVTRIEKNAFIYCDYLKKITVPQSVTYIGESAFLNDMNLNTIIYDGTVEMWWNISIGDYWVEDFLSIEIICTDGIIFLGEAGLYDGDGNLTTSWNELVLSGDITVSGRTITASSQNLVGKLVIPKGITTIGEGAFNHGSDTGITSIVLPDGVTTIEGLAFGFNRNLTSVTIPKTVTSIGMNIFYDIYTMTINYTGTMAEWEAITKDPEWNKAWDTEWVDVTVICTDGTI